MTRIRPVRVIALAGVLALALATAGCAGDQAPNEPIGVPFQRMDPLTKLSLYQIYGAAQDHPSGTSSNGVQSEGSLTAGR